MRTTVWRQVWLRSVRSVVILSIVALAVSCGGGAPEEGRPADKADGEVMRFQKLDVLDPNAGVNAFSMLIPKGWQHEGGIIWRPHLSNQAAAAMRVWNPNGTEVLELMPCDPFTWNRSGMLFQRPGSIYLGNEVRQPISDPAAYVMNIAIPRYRPEIQAPQLVKTIPLPKVAATTAQARAEAGVRKTGYAACVRVAYDLNGRAMEEDFVCVLLISVPMHMPNLALWGPDALYSFRAAAGTLDAAQPTQQAMVSSVRISPEWFNVVAQVQQMWVNNQMQAIRNAGRISRIISQTSSEISDMMMQTYENRQASQDRIRREFSELTRGVETYKDPYRSAPVELPSIYGHAWASANGEYIVTDSPGYNPNVGDNIEWTRLEAEP